jgi:DHA1 family tetracycline resistance protein-like MFS transporter
VSYILFAIGIITKNIPLLFFSRFFDGITGGNIAVAQAAIADVTTPENRAKNFGMIGAAFGLGFIFGPFIGGKLSDPSLVSWFTASTPFYFAAILAFLNVISIWKFLPETNKNLNNLKIKFNKSIRNIITAFNLPGLKSLFGTTFFFNAGFTFFTTFFSVFLIIKFGFSQGNIGTFFAYVGIWSVITQAVLTRIFAKKLTKEQILNISLFGCAVMLLAYFLPNQKWELYLVPPFFSLFTGLTMANLNALISERSDKTIQGQIMGISASVTALAQIVPAILSGFIAAVLKPTTPIIVASIFVFISFIVFQKAKTKTTA